MKNNSILSDEGLAIRRARYCCLAHFRSLFEGARIRHQSGIDSRQLIATPEQGAQQDLASATPHDVYCAELEASQLKLRSFLSGDLAIRHDSPQEVARARRIFALSLLIPMMSISAVLLLFGSALDRPLFSLLQFSTFALAVPLSASAAAWLARSFKRRGPQWKARRSS